MPVKLQSKCINIPVTFNCYQNCWKLIFNRPQLLVAMLPKSLNQALTVQSPLSNTEILRGGFALFCFSHRAPGTQWEHVDCSHRQIHTHTHNMWTAAIDKDTHTLFRTTVCGSSTTLTKTISPLTKQPGVTCITLCYISYQQKAESKWQVICFL